MKIKNYNRALIITILITILLCLGVLAFGQQAQIHGILHYPEAQDTDILVFHDGEMVAFSKTVDPFYSIVLENEAHYTILFRNGSAEKYCHVLMINMEVESIQVDIDFRRDQSIVLYKHKPHARMYTILKYGTGAFRTENLYPVTIK